MHPLPEYAFMARCLVKAQGQLYLYLLYVGVVTLKVKCKRSCKLCEYVKMSRLLLEFQYLKTLIIFVCAVNVHVIMEGQ
jgi:hypothetical protein